MNDAKLMTIVTPPVKLEQPTRVQLPTLEQIQHYFKSSHEPSCILRNIIKSNQPIPNLPNTNILLNRNLEHLILIKLVENEKLILASFSSSISFVNWQTNLNYTLVNLFNDNSNIKVHEGFFHVYSSLSNAVNEYLVQLLQDEKYNGYKVMFTGFSCGGAIATLHAATNVAKIKAMGHEVELITYASPRVGNREFSIHVTNLNMSMVRYTHDRDFVHHFPIRTLDYVHVPGEVYTPPGHSFSDSIICDQSYDEDPKCGWSNLNDYNVFDHFRPFGKFIWLYCD